MILVLAVGKTLIWMSVARFSGSWKYAFRVYYRSCEMNTYRMILIQPCGYSLGYYRRWIFLYDSWSLTEGIKGEILPKVMRDFAKVDLYEIWRIIQEKLSLLISSPVGTCRFLLIVFHTCSAFFGVFWTLTSFQNMNCLHRILLR